MNSRVSPPLSLFPSVRSPLFAFAFAFTLASERTRIGNTGEALACCLPRILAWNKRYDSCWWSCCTHYCLAFPQSLLLASAASASAASMMMVAAVVVGGLLAAAAVGKPVSLSLSSLSPPPPFFATTLTYRHTHTHNTFWETEVR